MLGQGPTLKAGLHRYKVSDNNNMKRGTRSMMAFDKSNQNISCINNKSECISDNDISQYVSKEKRKPNQKLHTEIPPLDFQGLRPSTFDNGPRTARLLESNHRSR